MGPADRSPLARSARPLWHLADHLQPVPAVVGGGRLGLGPPDPPGGGRPRRYAGRPLGHDRRPQGPRAPARRWRPETGGADPHSGRRRGGCGSKVHLITERAGKVHRGRLGGGAAARAPAGDSPPGTAPGTAVAGGPGSRASDLRTWLPARAIDAVIPDREDESGHHASDREADRERPISERAINRHTRFRGIATRYGTLASSSRAMMTIATILAWI